MADALQLLASGFNTRTQSSYSNASSGQGLTSRLASIFFRAILIFIVVMIILVFVHYTIRPVFKIGPGNPGIIPTPSLNYDDKVFWHLKNDVAQLPVSQTPIGSSGSGTGYSLTLDIQIDDGHQYNNLPRILFYKGGSLNKVTPRNSAAVTVASMVQDLSLVFALTRDTNDLQVAVVTADNNLEGVLLYNVPLRKPFRIGIILSENSLEVYTNGLLTRTKALSAPPKTVSGSFWPSALSGVQLRNLHIWPSVISPSEMRASSPALNTGDFDVSSLQETASCGATPNATAPTS